eukprot:7723377-Pyramimonas_sp.AAC.1
MQLAREATGCPEPLAPVDLHVEEAAAARWEGLRGASAFVALRLGGRPMQSQPHCHARADG